MSVIAKHEVQAALRTILLATAGLPEQIHTVWENRMAVEPAPVGTPYIRERLALMDSFRASHGDGLNRDEYGYMLDLYFPAGSDIVEASTAEQAVRSAFFFGKTQVVRSPWYLEVTGLRIGNTLEDLPNWYFLPVVIRLLIYGPPK